MDYKTINFWQKIECLDLPSRAVVYIFRSITKNVLVSCASFRGKQFQPFIWLYVKRIDLYTTCVHLIMYTRNVYTIRNKILNNILYWRPCAQTSRAAGRRCMTKFESVFIVFKICCFLLPRQLVDRRDVTFAVHPCAANLT